MQENKACFRLKFSKNYTDENSFIFVISSKNVKKAVSRNTIRRRAREILRKKSDMIKKGYDFVFIFDSSAQDISYQKLDEQVTDALSLARALK